MSEAIMSSHIDFEEIDIGDTWYKPRPIAARPDAQPYFSFPSDKVHRVILTTTTKKITLDFVNKTLVFVDGKRFYFSRAGRS